MLHDQIAFWQTPDFPPFLTVWTFILPSAMCIHAKGPHNASQAPQYIYRSIKSHHKKHKPGAILQAGMWENYSGHSETDQGISLLLQGCY